MDTQSKLVKTVILGGEGTGKTALVKKVSLARTTLSPPYRLLTRVEAIRDNSNNSTVYTFGLHRRL